MSLSGTSVGLCGYRHDELVNRWVNKTRLAACCCIVVPGFASVWHGMLVAVQLAAATWLLITNHFCKSVLLCLPFCFAASVAAQKTILKSSLPCSVVLSALDGSS